MGKVNDLTGQRFTYLTVINQQGTNNQNRAMWLCKCDCGNEKLICSHDLKHKTKSCGCYQKKVTSQNLNKGRGWNKGTGKINPIRKEQSYKDLKETRLKNIYYHMIRRCYNPKDTRYKDYGGRGITVCQEWLKDLREFYGWAVNNGYSENLTIDRKNNNEEYSPDNCRWVTRKIQSNNTRRNVYITFGGKTATLAKWADTIGIKYSTLRARLSRGWDVGRALEGYPHENMC
jgi:hypothetical protein